MHMHGDWCNGKISPSGTILSLTVTSATESTALWFWISCEIFSAYCGGTSISSSVLLMLHILIWFGTLKAISPSGEENLKPSTDSEKSNFERKSVTSSASYSMSFPQLRRTCVASSPYQLQPQRTGYVIFFHNLRSFGTHFSNTFGILLKKYFRIMDTSVPTAT